MLFCKSTLSFLKAYLKGMICREGRRLDVSVDDRWCVNEVTTTIIIS